MLPEAHRVSVGALRQWLDTSDPTSRDKCVREKRSDRHSPGPNRMARTM
jgi:hypothetical protein